MLCQSIIRCWDTHCVVEFDMLVALDKKSGDQQSYQNLSYGNLEYCTRFHCSPSNIHLDMLEKPKMSCVLKEVIWIYPLRTMKVCTRFLSRICDILVLTRAMDCPTNTTHPRATLLTWLKTRAPHFMDDSKQNSIKLSLVGSVGLATSDNLYVGYKEQQLGR